MMNNFIGTSLGFRCFLQRKTKSYPGSLYKKKKKKRPDDPIVFF
jgi:hypothetical protein